MGRRLVGLWLCFLVACVGDVREERMDGGVAEVDTDADSPTSDGERAHSPWFEESEDIARRYPAYGVTLHHMTYVYEAPKKKARPIGYLRRGARFRSSEEVSRQDCARGWFEVSGGGYVCNGEGVSIDSQPPAFEDSPVLPALGDAFPYAYRKIVTSDIVQYVKLPSPAEENAALAQLAALPVMSNLVAAAPVQSVHSNVRMRMEPGFYVSVDREIDAPEGARPFLRTVRGGYLRREQLAEAMQPQGIGVSLGEQLPLPIAFVFRPGSPVQQRDPATGELLKSTEVWPLHSAHALTGESLVKQGRRYFMTRDGLLLRDNTIRIVDKVARPKLVGRKERWIRVDLDRQTLTAYEGDTPVFATLVSSGVPDHATPTGLYRVHAKHVSTTMDDMVADGAYSIEDVPWTMYFLGSYALHAAFWHDKFGNKRSHGCVNLPARDARWLFFWTLPDMPSSWHGVFASVGKGTSVLLDTAVPYAIEQGGSLGP